MSKSKRTFLGISQLRPGTKVRVVGLHSTSDKGTEVEQIIANRKAGAVGRVVEPIVGHEGDIWLVKHEGDGAEAAYSRTELEIITSPLNSNGYYVCSEPNGETGEYAKKADVEALVEVCRSLLSDYSSVNVTLKAIELRDILQDHRERAAEALLPFQTGEVKSANK